MNSEFCRTLAVGDDNAVMQVAFLVDMVGVNKWGITLVYQGDNGKLMFHHLEPQFTTANAALAEVELNSEGLLATLL